MASAPRSVRALIALALAVVAAMVLETLGLIPGGRALEDWGSVAATFVAAIAVLTRAARVPVQRAAWALLGVGLLFWASGMAAWVLLFDRGRGASDLCLFWGLYPCALAFLVLELRSRAPRMPAGIWVDAASGFVSVGALFFGVAIPLLNPGLSDPAVLAFPVFDSVLLGFVVVMFTAARWQPGRDWVAIGIATLALSAGDLLWAVEGTSWTPAVSTLLWTTGIVGLAVAPWLQARPLPPASVSVSSRLPWPFGLFILCFGLLIAGSYVHVPRVGLWLAVVAMSISIVRSGRTYVAMRSLPETRRQARTDELTGLTNRRGFLDALDSQLGHHPGHAASILMLDLDRFKELNDTMGHQTGDRLLAELGPRLAAALRPGDTLARLGGDEFAVLCPGAAVEGARRVAQRLQDALDAPFDLGELQLHVDASVGIAGYPADGISPSELLQRADVAMYQAKGGGTEIEHYDASRDEHSRDKLALVGELRRGLDAGGCLELQYQPQASLRTDRVVAVEALVRWRNPQRGLLAPEAFLDAAEGAGLMRRIGREVLSLATAQAAAWQRSGVAVPVAVNLSTADLVDRGLADEVAEILRGHGLDGSWLKLEITENTVMAQPERVIETLHRLRALGCRISLDDFGTGHASLAHLVQLPVDELKIDRSFVKGLDADDAGSAAIVRSVALLGRDLQLSVVAEGVESARAWGQLVAAGCTTAQGFLLSRPLAAPDLEAWLRERRAAVEDAA